MLHPYNTPPFLHAPLAGPEEPEPEHDNGNGNVEQNEKIREMLRWGRNELQKMQR